MPQREPNVPVSTPSETVPARQSAAGLALIPALLLAALLIALLVIPSPLEDPCVRVPPPDQDVAGHAIAALLASLALIAVPPVLWWHGRRYLAPMLLLGGVLAVIGLNVPVSTYTGC